jgi:hypothetical protein
LRYQENQSTQKNVIINGNLDWWQRGTSFAAVATGSYTADRWQINYAGTSISTTVSRETTVPNAQSLYSIKVLQSSGSATSVTSYFLRQPMEIGQVENLGGKTITLSFYYRSNKTGSHSYRLLGDNATGSADSGGTFTVNVADTWEKKTLTTAVPLGSVTAWTGAQTAAGLYLDLGFRTSQGGFTSVALNDYFQVAQVQIEASNLATSFTRAGGTIQGELAACQRYYQKTFDQGTTPGNAVTPNGQVYFTRQATSGTVEPSLFVKISPTMRTAPSVTLYNPYLSTAGQWSDGSTNSANARTINNSDSGITIDNTDTAITGQNFGIHYALSAEL